MSHLLVKPHTPADGRILHITPESAGWRHVGFDHHGLSPGQRLQSATGDREVLLVFVAGRGDVDAGSFSVAAVALDDAPFSVYLPPWTAFSVTSSTHLELGVCSAPATGKYPPRLIRADEVGKISRGNGTNTRCVRDILPEPPPPSPSLWRSRSRPAATGRATRPTSTTRTICRAKAPSRRPTTIAYGPVRAMHPAGLHGRPQLGRDDGGLRPERRPGPRGYHPVAAPHGFDVYYLNVMAGPRRAQRFHNEPSYAFLVA